MDFTITEEQQALTQLAREFADTEIAPFAKMWDETSFFPVETLRKAASLGFAGLYVRNDIGGTQLSRLDGVLLFETLSRACVSTAAYLSVHNMVCWIIDQFGTEDQRQRYLPRLLTMEWLASYCLTEPDAGSDAASLKTSAVKVGDDYVLNGSKSFISGAPVSDIYLCFVRTGQLGAKGISCVIVEKNTEGLSFGQCEHKLGWRSQPTAMLFFNDCRIPAGHVVGELGQGFKLAVSALNGGRINIAACSLGGAAFCLEKAQAYLQERQQFQTPLSHFESLQFKLADMTTYLEAAKLMVYRAANALDGHLPEAPLYCAMAKQFATDHGFAIANQALQLLGGYGYLSDYLIERYVRDLRVHQILEGTNEIMRLVIARSLLNL